MDNENEIDATVTDAPYELLVLLEAAKAGDAEKRNRLIEKYKPFILSAASDTCGRYLIIGHDDEISIALMAFNEAINAYDAQKQAGFLSFARNVIKRRLIDYFRKESRRDGEILTSDFVDMDEERETNSWERKFAEDAHHERLAVEDRRDEIERFSEELLAMGISFKEIAESAPKHEDARLRAMELASMVVENPMLRQFLLEKKILPIKKLTLMAECSTKTIERQRKYIIAVAIVLMGDYHYLGEYIKIPQSQKEKGV